MTSINEWLATANGRRMNPDGHYGLQCVDVTDQYAEDLFGVPWPQSVGGVAGARQLLDAAPDEFWQRIDYAHGLVPQRGDVLVFAGDEYNQWGHTAVVESADQIGINVIQQDGFAAPTKFVDGAYYSDKPAHRARLAYRANGTGLLAGWLRPRPEKIIGSITPQSTITPISITAPKEWDEMASEDQIRKVVRAEVDASLVTMLDPAKDRRAGDGISWSVWKDRMLHGWNGDVSAEARIVGTDQAVNDIRAQLGSFNGQIAGLIGALAAINKGEPFDEAKLLEGVKAAAESGVKNAIESITVTVKEG
jgi:hypothetical protein